MSVSRSSDATAKRQRTCLDLRDGHYVSARALAAVATNIKLHGLPSGISRTTIGRKRSRAANRDTPFGQLIQERELVLNTGGCISLPFVHPAAILWVCCEQCPEFKEFFASVINGQRLQVAEYCDEVVPGRELIAYNDKKLWVLYWSFLDFGPAALSNEDAWLTGLTVRSSIVKKIAGGMGQVFKVYNKMFFDLDSGCDFRNGIALNVPNKDRTSDRTVVFAELGMLVQDADAHARVLDWKGSSGTKCCPLCLNIVKKGSALERDPTGSMKPLWSTDVRIFSCTQTACFAQCKGGCISLLCMIWGS